MRGQQFLPALTLCEQSGDNRSLSGLINSSARPWIKERAVKFSIKKGNLEKQRSACMVVGVYEPRKLTEAAQALDKAAGGYISGILRGGDMEGKAGSTLLLHNIPGAPCERVLLVGLGKEPALNEKEYRDTVRAAFNALNKTGAIDAALFLTETPVKGRDTAWKVSQTATVAM
jgi:leucyl aminopeptidase